MYALRIEYPFADGDRVGPFNAIYKFVAGRDDEQRFGIIEWLQQVPMMPTPEQDGITQDYHLVYAVQPKVLDLLEWVGGVPLLRKLLTLGFVVALYDTGAEYQQGFSGQIAMEREQAQHIRDLDWHELRHLIREERNDHCCHIHGALIA